MAYQAISRIKTIVKILVSICLLLVTFQLDPSAQATAEPLLGKSIILKWLGNAGWQIQIPVMKAELIGVTNQTAGQDASISRLAADDYFAAAVPLVEGTNQIQVLARTNDGVIGRSVVTVHNQPGQERSLALDMFQEKDKQSLELEVFLEREKNLKLEVERLDKSAEQIERDIEQNRERVCKAAQLRLRQQIAFFDRSDHGAAIHRDLVFRTLDCCITAIQPKRFGTNLATRVDHI
jgi:hypothetical protein